MYLLPPPDLLAEAPEPKNEGSERAVRYQPASPKTRHWLRMAALFQAGLVVVYAISWHAGGYFALEIVVPAVLLAQCLLAGWGLALGPGLFPVRFWMTFAWSVAISCSTLGIFDEHHGIGFCFFVGSWFIVSLLGLNATIVRKMLGWSLRVPADEEPLPKPQFSIRQLMLFTLIVSLYLGMARIADDRTVPGTLSHLVLVLATPSILLPAWLMLRVNTWKAACLIGAAVVLLPPATLLVLLPEPGSNHRAYALPAMAIFAMSIITTTLLMVRAAGYRLGPWRSLA